MEAYDKWFNVNEPIIKMILKHKFQETVSV